MIQFAVDGKPVSSPRPRVTRYGVFYKKDYVAYKRKIALKAKKEMRGKEPYECPLTLAVEFRFTTPSSWSKKRKEEAIEWGWMPQKPDIDNLLKTVMDACNGIIWLDDKQVVSVSAFKRYDKNAGIDVVVGKHADNVQPSDTVNKLVWMQIRKAENL